MSKQQTAATMPAGSLASATESSTSSENPFAVRFEVQDGAKQLQANLTAAQQRIAMLEAQSADMAKQLATSVPMILSYQPYIQGPPAPKDALWQQACSNDKVTSDSWRETWLKHIEQNVSDFMADEHMVDGHFGKYGGGTGIIAGSGPSLKKNVGILGGADPTTKRPFCPAEIPIVSCLHNFGFFVDHNVPCDYYVTLDAGPVVIPEMVEGGSDKDKTKYLKASEKKTLIAALVSPPELLRQWKGDIRFFNATIPDPVFMEKMPKLTKNKWVYSLGGNTLGACYYHAAFIFGCQTVALVGADFAFDYMHKFHSWDSGYDAKFAGLVGMTDVFGNRVFAWPSYTNFKAWFEFQAMGGQSGHHVQMVNCTEGGTLGAYHDGNIVQIKQQRLIDFLDGHTRWRRLPESMASIPEGNYTVMC